MSETIVFDACALIAFFNDETGADNVEKILQEAKEGDYVLIFRSF